MELEFPIGWIVDLARQYDEMAWGKKDQIIEDRMTREIFPAYLRDGSLTREAFLTVCAWKSPRPKRHCESNDAEMIKDVSFLALRTKSERLRIEAWMLLSGVSWPMASVFLHFAFPDRYTILDFRALESLGIPNRVQYTFPFWIQYSDRCQSLAKEAGVTLRVLDKALWQFSKLHQGAAGSCVEDLKAA